MAGHKLDDRCGLGPGTHGRILCAGEMRWGSRPSQRFY